MTSVNSRRSSAATAAAAAATGERRKLYNALQITTARSPLARVHDAEIVPKFPASAAAAAAAGNASRTGRIRGGAIT